jgi:hypothetical protein
MSASLLKPTQSMHCLLQSWHGPLQQVLHTDQYGSTSDDMSAAGVIPHSAAHRTCTLRYIHSTLQCVHGMTCCHHICCVTHHPISNLLGTIHVQHDATAHTVPCMVASAATCKVTLIYGMVSDSDVERLIYVIIDKQKRHTTDAYFGAHSLAQSAVMYALTTYCNCRPFSRPCQA